jgi:uncharacterized membrane protein YkoI
MSTSTSSSSTSLPTTPATASSSSLLVAHSPHYSQSATLTTPSLTSLLHQKLITTDSNINKQQLQSSSNQQPNANRKQILSNIASGLALAVSNAVSKAVSSVHQQMNNQEVTRQQQQQQQQQQQLLPHQQLIRQQLEIKEPNSYNDREISNQNNQQEQQQSGSGSGGNNVILRKRLSNINIEAAVATAVNRYLSSTIQNNQILTSESAKRKLDQDDNIITIN